MSPEVTPADHQEAVRVAQRVVQWAETLIPGAAE
jgi:hypothetical protein